MRDEAAPELGHDAATADLIRFTARNAFIAIAAVLPITYLSGNLVLLGLLASLAALSVFTWRGPAPLGIRSAAFVVGIIAAALALFVVQGPMPGVNQAAAFAVMLVGLLYGARWSVALASVMGLFIALWGASHSEALAAQLGPPLGSVLTWVRIGMVFTVASSVIMLLTIRVVGQLRQALASLKQSFENTLQERAARQLAYRQLAQLARQADRERDEERQRLSHDLHDELGQLLTAAKINLRLLGARAATPVVDETSALLDRALTTTRSIARTLKPPLLGEAGLLAATQAFLDEQTQQTHTVLTLAATGPLPSLSSEIENALFRIVQEAVSNVLRHSAASTATVAIEHENGTVVVSVRDDGRGFEVASLAGFDVGTRLGLVAIRERARVLGGDVYVASRPGAGTTVRARVPINGEGPPVERPAHDPRLDDLDWWKAELLRFASLRVLVGLIGLMLVTAYARDLALLLPMAAMSAIALFAWRSSAPLTFRAWFFVGAVAVLALLAFVAKGPVPGVTLTTGIAVVLAGLLMGRGRALVVASSVGAFIAIWGATHSAGLKAAFIPDLLQEISWWRMGLVFSTTSTVCMLIVARVVGQLRRTQATLRESIAQEDRERVERARAHDELGQLTRRSEFVRDEERRRLSQVLQQELGFLLTESKSKLPSLPAQAGADEAELIDRVAQLLEQALASTRELSRMLHPVRLSEAGVVEAVQAHVDEQARTGSVKLSVEAKGPVQRLSSELENALFRIVQEALTNVLRHAQAKAAVVTFDPQPESLQVSIRDDGRGFDVESVSRAVVGSHLGLVGIRERARSFGGSLSIASGPTSGTLISVRLPLKAAVAGQALEP